LAITAGFTWVSNAARYSSQSSALRSTGLGRLERPAHALHAFGAPGANDLARAPACRGRLARELPREREVGLHGLLGAADPPHRSRELPAGGVVELLDGIAHHAQLVVRVLERHVLFQQPPLALGDLAREPVQALLEVLARLGVGQPEHLGAVARVVHDRELDLEAADLLPHARDGRDLGHVRGRDRGSRRGFRRWCRGLRRRVCDRRDAMVVGHHVLRGAVLE
jgi:hypothetical protein